MAAARNTRTDRQPARILTSPERVLMRPRRSRLSCAGEVRAPPSVKPRYRFGPFTVAPSRRLLLHEGAEVPLIPRYFDLLVLLLERRGEAVHRRQIRDA